MKQITIKNLINKVLDMDSKINYWENPNTNHSGSLGFNADGSLKIYDAAEERLTEYKAIKEKCVAKLKKIGFDYDKLAAMIAEVADD